MIEALVKRYDDKRDAIKADIRKLEYPSYEDLLRILVEHIQGPEYGEHTLDPKRITRIDHGDYQGTLLFIVGAKGYQPYTFYATTVSYGSCSGCDTLQAITEQAPWDEMTDRKVDDLATLTLHMLQRMTVIE